MKEITTNKLGVYCQPQFNIRLLSWNDMYVKLTLMLFYGNFSIQQYNPNNATVFA